MSKVLNEYCSSNDINLRNYVIAKDNTIYFNLLFSFTIVVLLIKI